MRALQLSLSGAANPLKPRGLFCLTKVRTVKDWRRRCHAQKLIYLLKILLRLVDAMSEPASFIKVFGGIA